MAENKSLTIKLSLFVAGAIIIILGFMMIPIPMVDSWTSGYILVSVFLMYTAVFLPFLLHFFRKEKAGAVFTGGSVYYKGLMVYIAVSLLIMKMTAVKVFSHKVTIIAQLAALLVIAVFINLAETASEHTAAVEKEEHEKSEVLNEIKKNARNLTAAAESISSLDAGLKKKIEDFAENIRYVSPSSDSNAADLENMMYELLECISSDIGHYSLAKEKTLSEKVDQITLLCLQRKNIY